MAGIRQRSQSRRRGGGGGVELKKPKELLVRSNGKDALRAPPPCDSDDGDMDYDKDLIEDDDEDIMSDDGNVEDGDDMSDVDVSEEESISEGGYKGYLPLLNEELHLEAERLLNEEASASKRSAIRKSSPSSSSSSGNSGNSVDPSFSMFGGFSSSSPSPLEKAHHVKRQMSLWGSLLGLRIHLQKVLSLSHRFPHPSSLGLYFGRSGDAASNSAALSPLISKNCEKENTASKEVRKEALKLNFNLMKLLNAVRNKRRNANINMVRSILDEEEDEESCDEGEDNGEGEDQAFLRKRKQSWINTTPQKERESWHSVFDVWRGRWKRRCLTSADEWKKKTQLQVHSSFKVLDQSPSAQLRHAMTKNFTKLLQRSRPIRRRSYKIIGEESIRTMMESDEDDVKTENKIDERLSSEIYDDEEFYVQLLKGFLHNGGKAEGEDEEATIRSEGQRLLKTLGNRRTADSSKRHSHKSKAERRRIRYTPIPPLANFMAAVPFDESQANSQLPGASDENFLNRLMQSLFREE